MINPDNQPALRALLRTVAETGYAFVPPTPETHRRVNARPGNEEARDLRDVFGWSRPFRGEIIGGRIFELLREADALEANGPLWKSRLRIGRERVETGPAAPRRDRIFQHIKRR